MIPLKGCKREPIDGIKWVSGKFQWTKTYDECRNELGWLSLTQRRKLLLCCQVYKVINHLDCLDFNDCLLTIQ